jgi:chromosome partitioning protein
MRIGISADKGGVGKTTTALHLGSFLQRQGSTLVIDGDTNESAVDWAAGGKLPFEVMTDAQAQGKVAGYAHVLLDTEARPITEDLRELARQVDVMLLLSRPSATDLRVLLKTYAKLAALKNVRILLTQVPPAPSRAEDDARELLRDAGIPVCATSIRRSAWFEHASLDNVTTNQMRDVRASIAWSDYEALGQELQAWVKR